MAVKPQGVSHAEFNNNPGNIKAYNPDGSLNSWGRYLESKGYKFTKGSEGEKGQGFFAKYENKEDGLKATMSFWNEAKDWKSYEGLTLNQALQKYSGKGVKGNDGVVQTGYTVDSLGIKGLDGNKLLSEYTDKELKAVMANQLKTEGPKSFKSLVDDGLIKEDDLKVKVLTAEEQSAANVVGDAKKLIEIHNATVNVKTEVEDINAFRSKIDGISKSFANDLKEGRVKGDDDKNRAEYFKRISNAFGWSDVNQFDPKQLGVARGQLEEFFQYTKGESYGEKIGGDQFWDSMFEDMTEDKYYNELELSKDVNIPFTGSAPAEVYAELGGNPITMRMLTGVDYGGYKLRKLVYDESAFDSYLASKVPNIREQISTGESTIQDVVDNLSADQVETYIIQDSEENLISKPIVDSDLFPESTEQTSLLDLPNNLDIQEGVTDQERQDALDRHNNRLQGLMDEFSGDTDAGTGEGDGESGGEGTGSYADAMGGDDDLFKESFLDKIGGVSSLIGLATGVVGLGQALKEVDIPKDPKLGPAFQQRLEESKRMAQQGLTPSELAKAHNELDSSYAKGIENIVRGSAGNRAQFMAGLGGLDVARQSALMDIAVADAQMQRQNQEKYDGMMMMNEQYEAARESKYNNAKFEQDMMNKQAGAALAASALNMVNESIGDRQLNQLRKMQTQKMMRDMGYVPDSKGYSGQNKLGEDKDGNNLLEDINSLTSDGSQRTGLIENIKNKFNIKKDQKNNDPISLPSINYTAPVNTGLIDTRDQLNKNLQEAEKSLADQLKQQQLYNQQSFQTFDPYLNLK